ncbi:MAG: hypothetical protein DMD44_05930 [Gemmatimonadetes bacterium]|nr:MAG: hypothetical protein DMD44_05930 [Gemmatimonadota bacterium]
MALARGRFFAARFFALGLAAFRLAAGFRRGEPIGSSIIGAGVGGVGGAGGYSGSIIPGPVQLLSEKSVGSSIGRSLLCWLSVGAWPIAYRGNAATQVRRAGAAPRGSGAERS